MKHEQTKGGNGKMKNKYEVIVGNIGIVVTATSNKKRAEKEYDEYVVLSKLPHGRASGESVILMENGEPTKEYIGTMPF
jgi:hypothetical protein